VRELLGSLSRDLGHGFRTLRRASGFAAVVILTLALGIGATSAVFSVVNAVLLRPLPFSNQERLAVLWETPTKERLDEEIELSYPDYREWRDQNHVFSQLAAVTSSNAAMNLTGVGEPRQVHAAPVSHNFFSTLGVEPQLGRAFLPEDDRLEGRPVAVLGHRMWREQFGGDPRVIGRQIRLNAQSYTVVGVMPGVFRYPQAAQLWVPLLPALGAQGSELRINRVLKGMGRMKPGVTLERARSEMLIIAERQDAQNPTTNQGLCTVRPLAEEIVGDFRPTLLLLLVGVLLLLLIAVANVAHLLLARTLERRHEMGVRAALGATRSRVARQLLTEGLALGLLGGGGGLLLALLEIRILRALAPQSIPRIDEIGLDPPTLLFTLAVSLLAVAVFGTVPALGTGREDLHEPLREGASRSSGSARSNRLRYLLVHSEISLALVLLIGAGLTIQSMVQLKRIDLGFSHRNVLTVRIQLPEKTYPDVQQRQRFFDRLRERAAALPGVISAATVLARPLDHSEVWDVPVALEGQSWDELSRNPLTNFEAVSPGYFHALGIRLLAGRDFDAHDSAGKQPVTIISKSLAARFWPGQNPVGKLLRRVFADEVTPWMNIVGVVDDVLYRGWHQPTLDFYVPAQQNPLAEYSTSQDLVLYTSVDPASLARPLRGAVYALDPNQAVASIVTLDSLVDTALAVPRFTLLLMGLFGAVALCLAAVGIYGLLSYTVAQRSREIGIRMVLGARKQEILRMVIAQGLKLTGSGLAVGIVAALVLARFMVKLLYGVSTLEPLIFFSVPVFLAAIAFFACLVPAVRAARSEPTKMLRS
jgi:putative ABC transport system permease protein